MIVYNSTAVNRGGEDVSRQEDFVLGFRPAEYQWDYLGSMQKRQRSAYVRRAVIAYVEQHPTTRSIPLEEGPEEPIRHLACRFHGTPAIVAWLDQFPAIFRSYMIRVALRWYRKQELAQQQPTFNLDALEATGTDQ